MTERPFEDRSEVVKELYSELNVIKPHSGTGTRYYPCVVFKLFVDGLFQFITISLIFHSCGHCLYFLW